MARMPSTQATYCNRFWVQVIEGGNVKFIFGEPGNGGDIWHTAVVLTGENAKLLAELVNKHTSSPSPEGAGGGNVVPIKPNK
jgi:hypothetical protein